MSKTKNPPKAATLTESLRWHLRHCGSIPLDVAKAIGIHHASIYRFLAGSRGLSHDAQDRLAKYLKLRLVRDTK